MLILAMLLLHTGPAFAITTHYWRFDTPPGFLEDVAGGATLTPLGGSAPVNLPVTGRGSEFAVAIPGNPSALDVGVADYLTTPSFPQADFTIEMFVHPDVVGGSFGNTLAGPADARFNANIAWILQIRAGQLTLLLCEGGTCDLISSGLAMTNGKDYYVAAAVDLNSGVTQFYLPNLTDGGGLLSATKAHTVSTQNTPALFSIGATGDGDLGFDGLIDEVRLASF